MFACMRPLRPGSWRPELVVDENARWLYDPVSKTMVGFAGPLSRERVVTALPLEHGGPVLIDPQRVVSGADGFYLADPDGNLIGKDGLWVMRMLYARKVEDTRRL